MTHPARRSYPGAVTLSTAQLAALLRQARRATTDVEKLEQQLNDALDRRNAIFLALNDAGVSAQRISTALDGKPGVSGVRFGMMKAKQS